MPPTPLGHQATVPTSNSTTHPATPKATERHPLTTSHYLSLLRAAHQQTYHTPLHNLTLFYSLSCTSFIPHQRHIQKNTCKHNTPIQLKGFIPDLISLSHGNGTYSNKATIHKMKGSSSFSLFLTDFSYCAWSSLSLFLTSHTVPLLFSCMPLFVSQ